MKRFGRVQAAISVLFFANGAVVGCWVPFIPERAHALGLGAGALGVTLLGGGLGAVLAMLVAGALIPRMGSRLISIVGGVAFCVMLLLVAVAPSRTALFLALVAFGLSGAGMDVAMNAQAVLLEANSGRRVLSSLHGLYSLGNVAGSFGVSLAFASHAPHRLIAGALAGALAVCVLGCLPFLLVEKTAEAQHTKRSFAPRLLLLGSLVVAAMVSEGATADWSGVYLRNARALGPGWAGVGFGVFSVFMLCGRLLGDLIVSRLGEVRVLRFGGLIGTAGALLILLGRGWLGAMLGFALLGAGLANASPVLYRTAGQVPNLPPGVGLATAVGMGYAGLLAGPPMLGGAAQAFGLGAVFVVIALLCVLLSFSAGISSTAR